MSSQPINTVACPGCKQKYCPINRLLYVSSSCGHSVCATCTNNNEQHCIVCVPLTVSIAPFAVPPVWKTNFALGNMIRIAEENEKQLKKQSILEKTQAVQEMERQKRVVELEKTKKIEELEREKRVIETEKERIVKEMTQKCKIAEEKVETETRRADSLSVQIFTLQSDYMELKKKCEEELPNSIDHMACVDCLDEFKKEKMKICMECAEGKSSSHLPILCGFCVLEKHSNHKIIKYLPHTIKESFSSDVASGNETAEISERACTKMIEMGFDRMEKWKEEMAKFRDDVDFDNVDYRNSLKISSSLRDEGDVLHRAANTVIPVLDEFARTIQESSTRLSDLRQTLSEQSDRATVDRIRGVL